MRDKPLQSTNTADPAGATENEISDKKLVCALSTRPVIYEEFQMRL